MAAAPGTTPVSMAGDRRGADDAGDRALASVFVGYTVTATLWLLFATVPFYPISHSELTMYGFVTFAIWGGVHALLPLATGRAADPLRPSSRNDVVATETAATTGATAAPRS